MSSIPDSVQPGVCHGNGEDHCCYVDGKVCPFLEENTVSGRRWACGLLRELGTWTAVHGDERYLAEVRPAWDRNGVQDCGDWRGPLRDGSGPLQCCFAKGF